MLGTTVAERYVIVGRVGSGGMGTVYRAEQAGMGREVALKVLRKDLGRDPDTAARFHREARTLSQLKHPNTVTVFDFGQTSDRLLFLAMELLEGEMLSSRIKRDGPLDVLFATRTACGVLRSLDEAHARGIVHRDLKPDNIFLAKVHGVQPDESEVVKVVDFGIAKIRDGERGIDALQTQEGTVFGTPRYMSPEQAQGKPIDGRSDLYAVGVLLFHMLTGRPPFTDDDAVIVMAHHIKTVPPPVREVAANRPIPASLEAVVQTALSKDPSKRPQTAADFLKLLEATIPDSRALLAGAPTTSVSTVPTKAVTPKRIVTASIAALAVAATVVGLSTFRTPPVRATTRSAPQTSQPATTVVGSPSEAIAQAAAAAAAAPVEPVEPQNAAPGGEPQQAQGANTNGTTAGATPEVDGTNATAPSNTRAPRRGYRRNSGSASSTPASSTRRTQPGGAVVTRWND